MVGLDKKEALLLHLRSMNDEAAAGMHADAAGRASPQFVNAYSSVVLQLRDVSSTLPARPPARPPARLHACMPCASHLMSSFWYGCYGLVASSDQAWRVDTPLPRDPLPLPLPVLQVNGKVQDKLEQLDRPGSNGELAAAGGGGSAGLQHQQLGASLAADAALQRQLQAQTPEALSAAALGEAKAIVAACRGKISESAAEASAVSPAAAAGARDAQAPAVASGQDWGSAEGQQLSGLIEGCVHSLVLLQQGAESAALPAATLAAALDGALLAVQPHSAANRQLYAEIQAAMKSLKLQISAAS